MNRRVAVLLAVLVVVAGVAAGLQFQSGKEAVAAASGTTQGLEQTRATQARTDWHHPRIEDSADILAPFGPRLGRMADAFNDDFGIDLHIVTSAEGSPSIEKQADALFRQRGIGKNAATGGLLIVLNPKLASARIEVGYTLEGALTDLHMSRLARDQLAPYTSYSIAGMAVMDVLHYLRDHVYVSAAAGNLALGENFKARPTYVSYERFLSGGAGAKTKLASVPMDRDLKAPIPEAKRARYAPSSRIEESVAAFLRASAELAGDPTLELFTEGSRLMRMHYPLARFEEMQRFERLERSLPLEYLVQGDYAVGTSRKPAKGFVPVLLHREGGLWRIDLVETWKNLFFDPDGNYFLRNSNTPYAFGLGQFGKGTRYNMAAISLGGRSISDALKALENRHDADSELRRAELWLRNTFVFPQAFLAYEAAREAAPNDPIVLEAIGERARYLGFPELAIPALEHIGRGLEFSLAEAYNEAGDIEGASRWIERSLAENPYEWTALHWQQWLADKAGRAEEAKQLRKAMQELGEDPRRLVNPVVLYFNPEWPRYEPESTVQVEGTTVYDHSKFAVTLHNTSNREVEIDSVMLTSMGNAAASGLGDIRGYWHFPSGPNRLRAGESVWFDKVWGFTVDTGHQHVRYVFHTCWHGVGSTVRQCRTQWIDAFP